MLNYLYNYINALPRGVAGSSFDPSDLSLDLDFRPNGFSGADTEWNGEGALPNAVQVGADPMPDENAGWLQFTEADSEHLVATVGTHTTNCGYMTVKPDTANNLCILWRSSGAHFLQLNSSGNVIISGVNTGYTLSNGTEYIIIWNDDNGGGALEHWIYDNTGTLLDSGSTGSGSSGNSTTSLYLGSTNTGAQLYDGQMNHFGFIEGGSFSSGDVSNIVDYLVANM